MVQITVLLEIQDKDSFRKFESAAIKIMEKYNGKLLLAYKPSEAESSISNIGEVHYLEFPNIDAFKNYRVDSELKKLSELQDKAISNSIILVSGENVAYQ